MIFYITVFPAVFILLLLIVKQLRFGSQNNALYRFCELRREIISYMRSNYTDLSRKEHQELERILNHLSKTIHYFHEMKIEIFSFSSFKEIILEIINGTNKVEKRNFEFDTVKQFQEKFASSYVLAYTDIIPFFKWRATAYLIFLLSYALGANTLKEWYDWLKRKTLEHKLDSQIKLT